MNIFVAKLDYSIQEADLRTYFEDFGEVNSVKIINDKFTGRSKGFGFVEMANDDEAQNAINELNGTEIENRAIVVKKAKPREARERNDRYQRNGYNNRDRY